MKMFLAQGPDRLNSLKALFCLVTICFSSLGTAQGSEYSDAVDADNPPSSVQALIDGASGKERNFATATHLIGTVRRFAEFCESNDAVWVAAGVMPHETATIRQQVSQIDEWLDVFVANIKMNPAGIVFG